MTLPPIVPSLVSGVIDTSVTAIVPATVTANAGTNLNTSALALESGGNLATLAGIVSGAKAAVKAAAGDIADLATLAACVVSSILKVSLEAVTSGGATPGRYIASGAANQDATQLKASAGQVYDLYMYNNAAAPRFVKLYDKASGATSADTPVATFGLPAGTTGGGGRDTVPVGDAFANGIQMRITTGMADNDTGTCAANDVAVKFSVK